MSKYAMSALAKGDKAIYREQTWLDEETALKAAARKGWGFESLLLRHLNPTGKAGTAAK